ncbi:MAG: metallophosphoesterase [Bryobacteraceae bacterium]|nr:metallophosphoesterase [Bryobacteraceae bacterium]
MLRLLLPLLFCLLPAHSQTTIQDTWPAPDRIVAIGDVHGDYPQFFTLLEQTGLVDNKGRWKGGKTHLVQVGDVPDRGPDTRKIMDLLMRLEKQAAKAGGRVHSLIGNHEAMNVYGDLRYVIPEEYASFRDGNSERVRDFFYEQHVEELKKNPPPEGLPAFDHAYRKQWDEKYPLGYFEHRVAFGPKGAYGKWIRENNAIVKIGDSLFLHGGISPKYAAQSLAGINAAVRAELDDFSKLESGVATDEEGPLWYRGLAQGPEAELAAHVDAVLKNLGAARIVIAHTPTAGTVIPRFGAKVLAIDVGLSKAYGSRLACLVIEKGRPYTLHRGVRIDLPADEAGLPGYLKRAAALDPQPSPLESLLRQFAASAAR